MTSNTTNSIAQSENLQNLDISAVRELILSSKDIILTTHKNSDGDGLGSLAGLYWALQTIPTQKVNFMPVDQIPDRYSFLTEKLNLISQISASEKTLLIVLDTNQGELCSPVYDQALSANIPILFIDHHIEHITTSSPKIFRHINKSAASTGEVIYDLILNLDIPLDDTIAEALYASLTFDTQAFKLVKNSSRSHLIASHLADFKINTEKIQRSLFAHWTPLKMNFLAELISTSEYQANNQVVGLYVDLTQLEKYKMSGDDVNDLIDLFTLIPTIKFAYLIRETSPNEYKISFRSTLSNMAYTAAFNLGGGGHAYSSGVWLKNTTLTEVKNKIQAELKLLHLA